MTAMFLKIVPDDAPNADGLWIEHDVPPGVDVYGVVPRKGFHVVQAVARFDKPPRQEPDLQDGGPMHAAFLHRRR